MEIPPLARVSSNNCCDVGRDERRLDLGHDIELHFASKNPAEENGAVIVTYQSQIPGFKGDDLSSFSSESLRSSATIRLLCHMLREPLFDDLRTKQQLGYIVQSYFDIGFATRPFESENPTLSPITTPVDFIVINVLSKKIAPPAVASRIDEFLASFGEMLSTMPESEIRDHAHALGEQLLKPIQKLGTESSIHFGKIERYGPEILADGQFSGKKMPWSSVKSLAHTIQELSRSDLLSTWDRMVLRKESRSRVVSLVYGQTFPLKKNAIPSSTPTKAVVVNDVGALLQLRQTMKHYDSAIKCTPRTVISWKPSRSWGVAAAAAILGAGVLGAVMTRNSLRK